MDKFRKLFDKNTLITISGIIIVIFLFIFMSFIASKYENEIYAFAEIGGLYGMLVYVFITTIAVVVAPISTIPLIPLATDMWGWFITGILSIIGWTIGAQIAFILARCFGRAVVQKIISIEKLSKFQDRVPDKNLFWSVVFLRVTIPVDVLSYVLGLFSRMKSIPFFLSTLIGVAPFAFVFSYLGELPLGFQVTTILEMLVLVIMIFIFKKNKVA